MRRWFSRLALVAASLALAGPVPRAAEKVAPPPDPTGPARFTSHARFVDAQLSPKGTWLAVVSVEGGKRSLSFIRLADRKMTGRLAPDAKTMVGQFNWANDERVVAGLWRISGPLAAPASFGELMAVNPEGATCDNIFGTDVRRHHPGADEERASAWVVDPLRHDDRRILIGVRQWGEVGDARIRLVKLDIYNASKTEVAESPLPNSSYLTDEAGEPRIAWSPGEDAKPRILFRDDQHAWRPVSSLPGLTPASRPWHYRASDRTLEVMDPVAGGFSINSVSIDSGERKVVATTTLATPSRILRDRVTGRVLAVESQPDLPDWQLLEPAHPLVQVLAGLLDAHPGLHVDLVSRTEDDRLAIAHVYGDRDPGRFLLVDVARRSAEPLLENRPWIKPEQMAEMTAFHIKASDGQPIHGYVTYPSGLPAGVKPPLVVLPHGGPFGVRDRWGFNPEVQLLASDGFAVLQVNFRGSGGYGEAYQEAGYRHWGDRMIEDLLDATRWLVKKEKVDGARMCTYGGSFGGYAALQAVSLAPGLFRCAVGFAGVYDLTRLEHNDDMVTSGRARGFVRTTVGEDEAALKAASPVFHADLIKVPVLLIHGGKDKRVPIVHAEKLREALTALGRPPEWLEEPLEGHGFYDEAARARQYARLVEFLKRHTAPRP